MNFPNSANKNASTSLRSRPVEDVVYQVVTVGAILMMLGTLWIF